MIRGWIGWSCLACSVAVHAGAFTVNGAGPREPRLPQVAEIQWIAPEPMPEPPEPEPEAEPEPPPPPPVPPPVPKTVPKPAAAPPQEHEPAAPEPELDPQPEPPASSEPELTGTTLVADASNGIALPAGNGEARRGVVTAGARRARPQAPPTTEPLPVRATEATQAVPLSALSRKPVPPPLMALLERHYPQQARRMGLSGEARVRALIAANGSIRQTRIAAESAAGFGTACSTALRQSRWEPPLDRRGKPAATWITYRCTFRIDR